MLENFTGIDDCSKIRGRDRSECKKRGGETEGGTEERWLSLKCIVTISAEAVLGYESKEKEADWFDDECKKAVEERSRARLKKLERITRASAKEYSEKGKMAKKYVGRKKEKKNGTGS
jgi:hypothetical protein